MSMTASEDSLYKGGVFKVEFDYSGDIFAFSSVGFKTKIYHPNINQTG